jgi:quercetin dioxygenase-like cupin family protein
VLLLFFVSQVGVGSRPSRKPDSAGTQSLLCALSLPPKKPNSFFFVTDGEITITLPIEEEDGDEDEGDSDANSKNKKNNNKNNKPAAAEVVTVSADGWAYFPPGWDGEVTSSKGASLVAFERIFAKADADPVFLHGRTDDSPLLPTAPEVFRLRKLLPQTGDYDFNVHVMDFSPGEFLEVKEVHYNQHGMIILQGQGIYRLGERFMPVQAGDAIWMAPFVPQWYAALGRENTRYLLYKDVGVDPLVSP